MSSFGAVVVVDTPADSAWSSEAERVEVSEVGSWVRHVIEFDIEDGDPMETLSRCPTGARVAIAEDFDEYGARFRVVRVGDQGLDTVYEAYVVNADPSDEDDLEAAVADLEDDPRPREKAGAGAAREAALLFDVDPAAMLAIEDSWRDEAWKEIGIIGGPFPWWDALRLPWPHE